MQPTHENCNPAALPVGSVRFIDLDGRTYHLTARPIPLHFHIAVDERWFRRADSRDDEGRYVYEETETDPRPTVATVRANMGRVH